MQVTEPSRARPPIRSKPCRAWACKLKMLLGPPAMPRLVGKYGGPEVLKFESMDPPEPGPGEARVRMKALALNRANALFREGKYMVEAPFPSRIGAEGVGVIDKIAPDVIFFSPGIICAENGRSPGQRNPPG